MPDALAIANGYVYVSAYFHGSFNFGFPDSVELTTDAYYSLALSRLSLSGTNFSHSWSRQYGTDVWASKLAADPSGDVYVAGTFGGTLDIDDAPLDEVDGTCFLAKIDDATGDTVWAKQLANVEISAMAVGQDGSIYVVGRVQGVESVDLGGGPLEASGTFDPFVARYAPDGTHRFSRVFSAPVGSQSAVAVDVDADDQAWVGVNYDGEIDLGLGNLVTQGGQDFVVVRYAP